jgi:uncharacterized membrane-anchored protein YhcB (DUF1043 family)
LGVVVGIVVGVVSIGVIAVRGGEVAVERQAHLDRKGLPATPVKMGPTKRTRREETNIDASDV